MIDESCKDISDYKRVLNYKGTVQEYQVYFTKKALELLAIFHTTTIPTDYLNVGV